MSTVGVLSNKMLLKDNRSFIDPLYCRSGLQPDIHLKTQSLAGCPPRLRCGGAQLHLRQVQVSRQTRPTNTYATGLMYQQTSVVVGYT